MLTLKNVFRTYQNGPQTLHALNDVNLHFEPGDFTFILGASGSGKSTMLNLLSGLDKQTKGTIVVDGIDTKNFSKKDWAIYRNHYVGFVFQEYNLISHLSVLENVMLPLLFQGKSRKEAAPLAEEELEKIGLKKHVHKKPAQLSGGQQQRVSIARALVTNPKIIMADEPTGALDEALGHKVIAYLKKYAKDKVVIIVTHDEDLANAYANRIVRIGDGKIIDDSQIKSPKEKHEKSLNLTPPKMRFSMLLKFAKNNLFSRMFRSLFTASIVSIGFVAILLLTFIILGITGSLSENIAALIPPDEYQIQAIEQTPISSDTLNTIREYENVEDVRYLINENFRFTYPHAQTSSPMYFYTTAMPKDPLHFERNQTLYGRLPENENEIIINVQTALQLLSLGTSDEDSYLYLFERTEGRTLTLVKDTENGVINQLETFTIVGLSTEQSYSPVIYADYDKLISILNEHFEESLYTHQAVAYLHDTSEASVNDLTRTLRTEHNLVLINLYNDITNQIESTMFTALRWFVGIAALTLIVSSILIGLVIYTSVLERIREIGILTAIGARSKNITGIFLLEAGMTGLMSSIIASFLAYFIARGLNNLFTRFIETPLNLLVGSDFSIELLSTNVLAIGVIVLFSVLYAMVSGLIPSMYASKLNAVDALRKE